MAHVEAEGSFVIIVAAVTQIQPYLRTRGRGFRVLGLGRYGTV